MDQSYSCINCEGQGKKDSIIILVFLMLTTTEEMNGVINHWKWETLMKQQRTNLGEGGSVCT